MRSGALSALIFWGAGAGARSYFKHGSGSALQFETWERERERAPFSNVGAGAGARSIFTGSGPIFRSRSSALLIFKAIPICVEGREEQERELHHCVAWIVVQLEVVYVDSTVMFISLL